MTAPSEMVYEERPASLAIWQRESSFAHIELESD